MYTAMKEPSLFKKMMFACGANVPEVKAYKETKDSASHLSSVEFEDKVKAKYLSDDFATNRMNQDVCYIEIEGKVYTFSKKELDILLIKSR